MPAVKGDGMRGLAVFISDIRNCKSKEAEVKRINKELANIRSKFKGDKTLDGYQKKKYVCKLLFIFLLGHDIDFGHMEAVNLLSSNKYTEKQIGYLFISVLVSASSDLMKLVIQSIKNDLGNRNPVHICLALQCIANIGSREMAEGLGQEIPKILVSGDTIDQVKQSAALCLLRLLRTSSDLIRMGEWAARVIHLLNDQHMGVVTAAASLIENLVKRNPEEYKGCVSLAVSRLSRIVTSSYTDLQDYTYYFVPAPWLSVKLLRLLQNYPPPEDAAVKNRLNECLETILNKAQEPPKSKKVQHSNAKNAVLFEAINLIIHTDSEPNLLVRACNQLGQFLQHRETNLRYLALESMCLLATSEFSHEAVKKHQETIVTALKTERDVSVRQRAVDLLYAMCDRSNAEEIVGEMLAYLETADYSIREEMVLKVAILAEKYAVDYTWYVDTILNLIRIAGDYVSEEVWYRVIQIVINRDDVQGYAAKTVFEALQAPACHENMVKVGGYILGEFGNLIAGDPRSSPQVQFELLHTKYHLCSAATRGLLLSTYIKFVNLFPEIKQHIQDVLRTDSNVRSADVELQQRTVEYLQLSTVASTDVLATVLEEMPPFPERESSILAKLKKKRPDKVKEVIEPREPRPAAQISNNAESQPTLAAQVKISEQAAENGSGCGALLDLVDLLNDPASANTNIPSDSHTASTVFTDLNTPFDPNTAPKDEADMAKGAFFGVGIGTDGGAAMVTSGAAAPLVETNIFEESTSAPPGVSTEQSEGFGTGLVPADAFSFVGSSTGVSQAAQVSAPPAAASVDLLGLGGPSNPAPAPSNTGILMDMLGDLGGETSTDPAASLGLNGVSTQAEDNFNKFICKNNGVLYESDLLQIGVKSEFRQNLGRIGLFFGNKTSFPLTSFTADVTLPGTLPTELTVQAKPVEPTIEAGAQKQMLVNIECIMDFLEAPLLNVTFMYSGAQQRISVKLPLMINKFIEPTEMDSASFFQRWKALSGETQECQKIMKATLPMEMDQVNARIIGFGLGLLQGIDPNPENYVGAGVVNTTKQQVGCLLRLEPNKQAQMYRLTLRASKESVAQRMCELMESQL